MARLTWDSLGDRYYEFGVDRGVLFVGNNPGVAWNGLINVTDSPSGGEESSYYIDGMNYYTHQSVQDFGASIEAYTYPDEFLKCDGVDFDSNGVGFTQQSKARFGLVFRTMIGEGTQTSNVGYKIHIIYNAQASPAEKPYSSLDDSFNIASFNWDISALPVKIPGKWPTPYLIIDSRKAKSDTLATFEDIIYGTANTKPRLPYPEELSDLFEDWSAFQIVPRLLTGLNDLTPDGPYDDLSGDSNTGLYSASSKTRLKKTDVDGLYKME